MTETLFMWYSLYVKLQQHKKYLLLKQKQMSKIWKMGIKNNTLKEVLEETLEIYKEITSNTKEALILFNQDNLINFSQK